LLFAGRLSSVITSYEISKHLLAQPAGLEAFYLPLTIGVIVGGFFFSMFLPLFCDSHLGSHKKKMIRLAEEQGKVKPDFDTHWMEGDEFWWMHFAYIVFSLIGIFLLVLYLPWLLLPICAFIFWLGYPALLISLTLRDKRKQREALKAAPKAPRGYWKALREKERRRRKIAAIIVIAIVVTLIIVSLLMLVFQLMS
jgi:hypothetical protein